jgi:hypothetical protein
MDSLRVATKPSSPGLDGVWTIQRRLDSRQQAPETSLARPRFLSVSGAITLPKQLITTPKPAIMIAKRVITMPRNG